MATGLQRSTLVGPTPTQSFCAGPSPLKSATAWLGFSINASAHRSITRSYAFDGS